MKIIIHTKYKAKSDRTNACFYVKSHTNILFDLKLHIVRPHLVQDEFLNLSVDHAETKIRFSLANVSMSFTKFRVGVITADSIASVRPDAARRDATRCVDIHEVSGPARRGCRVPTLVERGRKAGEIERKRETECGSSGGSRGGGRTPGVAAQPAAPSKAPAPLEPAKRIPDDDDDERQRRRRTSSMLLLGALLLRFFPSSSDHRTDAHRPTTPGALSIHPSIRSPIRSRRRDAARPRNPGTFERVKVALRRDARLAGKLRGIITWKS